MSKISKILDPFTLGTLMREYIEEHIKDNGGTHELIAKKIGCSKSVLSKFLSGERDISAERLMRLVNFLRLGEEAIRSLFALTVYELPHYLTVHYTETRSDLPSKGELPDPGDLPIGSRFPFLRNAIFSGRGHDLSALADFLIYSKGMSHTVALCGIAGVGKTQLAIEFCYRFGRYFDGVHWISAADSNTIMAEIVECGERMGLQPWPDLPKERLALTLRALDTGRRLIVFDNIDGPEVLNAWLPNLSHSAVLATSRHQEWPSYMGLKTYILDVFMKEESIELLRRLVPRLEVVSEENISELADILGHLALALDLAGRFLHKQGRMTLSTYIANLNNEKNLLKNISLNGKRWLDEGSPTGIPLAVISAFNISWKRFGKERKHLGSRIAQKMFFAMGWCQPNIAIPVEVLDNFAKNWNATSIDVEFGLYLFYNLGLLSPSLKGPTIHPLIADFAQLKSSREILPLLAKSLNEICEIEYMTGRPDRYARLLPHLRHVATEAEKASAKLAGTLWNNYGSLLYSLGDFKRGQEYIERIIRIQENKLGSDDPDLADLYLNLGQILTDQGKPEKALGYFYNAIHIWEKTPDQFSHPIAVATNNIGNNLQDQGNLPEALNYYKRALAIWEKEPNENEVIIAIALNNIGDVLRGLGDYDNARLYLERAKSLWEGQPDGSHPYITHPLINLSRLCVETKEFQKAKEYAERALLKDQQIFGDDHPNVGLDHYHLGNALAELGDFTNARQCYETALQILKKYYPDDHTKVCAAVAALEAIKGK